MRNGPTVARSTTMTKSTRRSIIAMDRRYIPQKRPDDGSWGVFDLDTGTFADLMDVRGPVDMKRAEQIARRYEGAYRRAMALARALL